MATRLIEEIEDRRWYVQHAIALQLLVRVHGPRSASWLLKVEIEAHHPHPSGSKALVSVYHHGQQEWHYVYSLPYSHINSCRPDNVDRNIVPKSAWFSEDVDSLLNMAVLIVTGEYRDEEDDYCYG